MESRRDGFLVQPSLPQMLRDPQWPEAPRLGPDGVLREARIGKPATLRKIVEDRLEVLALRNVGRKLSSQFIAGVLPACEKTHGPGTQGRFGPHLHARATPATNSYSPSAASGAARGMPPAMPTASRIFCSISCAICGLSLRYSRVLSLPWPIFSPP